MQPDSYRRSRLIHYGRLCSCTGRTCILAHQTLFYSIQERTLQPSPLCQMQNFYTSELTQFPSSLQVPWWLSKHTVILSGGHSTSLKWSTRLRQRHFFTNDGQVYQRLYRTLRAPVQRSFNVIKWSTRQQQRHCLINDGQVYQPLYRTRRAHPDFTSLQRYFWTSFAT